jgi:ABC-type polysaccharide/polyol phosphate export permease
MTSTIGHYISEANLMFYVSSMLRNKINISLRGSGSILQSAAFFFFSFASSAFYPTRDVPEALKVLFSLNPNLYCRSIAGRLLFSVYWSCEYRGHINDTFFCRCSCNSNSLLYGEDNTNSAHRCDSKGL